MEKKKLILCTGDPEVISYFEKRFEEYDLIIMSYDSNENKTHRESRNVFKTSDRRKFSSELQKRDKSSICVSCFTSYIFSKEDILHFQRPIINFHTGKIPDNRGRSPLFWDIIEGKERSYGTLHTITEQIDMGQVLEEVTVEVETMDTPRTLAKKLLKEVFEKYIFEKWISATAEEIHMVKEVSSEGAYKKAFIPDKNYKSSEITSDEALNLWRCYKIWDKIKIER